MKLSIGRTNEFVVAYGASGLGIRLGLCPQDPAEHSPKERRGPAFLYPWKRILATGTWNVISPGVKEPEPVQEVEQYQLELVGLTSM